MAVALSAQTALGDAPPLAAGALASPPAVASKGAEIARLREDYVAAHKAGDQDRALALAGRVVELVRERSGDDCADYALALNEYAALLSRAGRAAEAEPLHRRALDLNLRLLGPRHPDTLLSLSNLAADLARLGRFAEAEPLDRAALTIRTELLGDRHPDVLTSLNMLAGDLRNLGRFAEAEAFDSRALELSRELLGERHADTLAALSNLALDLNGLGRFGEAEALDRKALALLTETLGEHHPYTLTSLGNLAADLRALGQAAEAEALDRKALALSTRLFGERHSMTLRSINNLALDLRALGRAGEAETLDRKAVALRTEVLGGNHPDTLVSLNNLAFDLRALGRAAEAEPIDRMVLALMADIRGERHPETFVSLNNLASDLRSLGRSAEAEPIFRKVLALRSEVLGDRHPDTLRSLSNLALNLNDLRRFGEAEALDRKALSLRNDVLGDRHPETVISLSNLALDLNGLNRPAEAEPFARRALAISMDVLGARHPDTLISQGNLAMTLLMQHDRAALALPVARSAVATIRSMRATTGFTPREEAQRTRDAQAMRSYFPLLADAAWTAAQTQPALAGALRVEAFSALQDAMAGVTSQAVALAAARRLAEDQSAELGALAVERQALSGRWRANEEAFTRAFGETGPDADAKRAYLRETGHSIEARMALIDERLRKEAPAYFTATRPEAIALDEARAILKPDEAVIMIVPTAFGTHVMALTRDGLEWNRAVITATEVAAKVAKLRAGLDIEALGGERVDGIDRPQFDRAVAHELYRELIAPSLPALRGKTQLFIAADGPLASLPFAVLVAAPPQGSDASPIAQRGTHWFADDYALVQIPSFQSLHFLRTFRNHISDGTAHRQSFAGFGDPKLRDEGFLELAAGVGAQVRGKGVTIGSIAGSGVTLDGGGLADVVAIRALPNLPGTRKELEKLRIAFNAPVQALHLGAAATERNVRSMPLAPYRVLAFATHGAISGEIRGVAEPGLIFTPPTRPSSEDDGYLAASEITGLRLDADYVILSACNTAAGGAEGSTGLSGLARAFFYAGARNLLVSHWVVDDEIAPLVTAEMIRRQQLDPHLSRARALQQSLRKVREMPGAEHPSLWAPFTLVGDGD